MPKASPVTSLETNPLSPSSMNSALLWLGRVAVKKWHLETSIHHTWPGLIHEIQQQTQQTAHGHSVKLTSNSRRWKTWPNIWPQNCTREISTMSGHYKIITEPAEKPLKCPFCITPAAPLLCNKSACTSIHASSSLFLCTWKLCFFPLAALNWVQCRHVHWWNAGHNCAFSRG